jgi:uncharacterized protein
MPPRDDSLMSRFDRQGLRRFRARDAVLGVALACALLILFAGASVRRAGEQMSPGIGRDLVLAVGRPAGWVADRLPLQRAAHRATAWLSPDQPVVGGVALSATVTRGGVPEVTGAEFPPGTVGPKPPPRPLKTLVVTGDSMSQPLDVELARRLTPAGVKVIRDAHLGTGISKSILVDWTKLAPRQAASDHPDVVVMFIGANEGFPLKTAAGRTVGCCGLPWATAYATRVRQMMAAFRRAGRGHVYWLTLPAPREAARARIARTVNAAVRVAADAYRAQVTVLGMDALFTPGGRYRAAMPVGGTDKIVREPDGIHLNDAGAKVAAGAVLAAVRRDFGP